MYIKYGNKVPRDRVQSADITSCLVVLSSLVSSTNDWAMKFTWVSYILKKNPIFLLLIVLMRLTAFNDYDVIPSL